MEKWLFLHKERKVKVERFAYDLRRTFGNLWDFSEFTDSSAARRPLPDYSLEKLFEKQERLEDAKLVIGQVLFKTPKIRFAFRYGKIWSDFLLNDSPINYEKVDGLFYDVFGNRIVDYRPQQKVD